MRPLLLSLLLVGACRSAAVAPQAEGIWQCRSVYLSGELYKSSQLSLEAIVLTLGPDGTFELRAGEVVVAHGSYSHTIAGLTMRTEREYIRVRMEDDRRLTFYRYIPGHGNYELRFERQ